MSKKIKYPASCYSEVCGNYGKACNECKHHKELKKYKKQIKTLDIAE